MLLTTLFAAFVLGFVILTVIGHVLVLQAILHRADTSSSPSTAPTALADEPPPAFEHRKAA